MEPVRWGILGTARIATKVVPAIQKGRMTQVVALGSRDGARAREAAARLGIATAHDSYEALLADPAVEAVYNPLPNHLHVPWSVKAMEAGKHVLCEKPVALTADEARQLLDAERRTGRRVAEAFMVRHHAQWLRARSLANEGGSARRGWSAPSSPTAMPTQPISATRPGSAAAASTTSAAMRLRLRVSCSVPSRCG